MNPAINVGTIGHRSCAPRVTITWIPPGSGKQEKILYYTGEDARNILFPEVMRLHHINLNMGNHVAVRLNTLPVPYLGFENGGLLVAGKVIWILPSKQWSGYHRQAAVWVLPTKEYLKSVLEKAKENPPQVKGTRDEVHSIEFTSLNDNFGIKARVEPLFHSLGAKEILQSCLVNTPITKWDDPVNYAQAVEDGFVGTYKEWQWSEIEK